MAKKNIVSKVKKANKPQRNNVKGKKILKNEKSKVTKPREKDYSSMSMDDFLDNEIDRPSDEENESESDISSNDDSTGKHEMIFEENDENAGDAGSESEEGDEFESHKQSLAKLKETDPEFFKFLEENDKKLLQFRESDSEDDEKEDDDKEDDDDDDVHKPSGELEVASDESDFEPDDEDTSSGDNKVITLKLLKAWQNDIQSDKSVKTIAHVIQAFHAALVRVSTDEQTPSEFKVDGSAIFNGVVQLCVLELGPAIRRFLRLPAGSKQAPHKCKRFVKIRGILRSYLVDLLKLLGGVTSSNIQNVLLKHLHYMSPFIVSYSNITKKMLKRLIHLWGTAEETVRIVAFMCILRITNNQQASYLDLVLKSMYMTYVKNCKFMSTTTLAEVNFMRRSLTEMFALDVNVSYQHVFLYIRQLAIHLRSAVTLHKKENIQAVYNWQYVNSLHLWASLLTITCNKPQLQPLIYPLVQVTIGTIKLLPTAQYFPLRFHCLQILVDLSRDTNIFIPILPLLLEVLTTYDFNKKHKKVSMKPIQFTCLLRLSKSQMIENGFKDTSIDTFYGLLLEYLASQSHSISFPDSVLSCITQLKQFLKKCSVANYTKKMRQLLEKIEQNSVFIENERKKITFNINDFKQIEAWETTIKNKGTPVNTFFENWRKLHNIKKRKQLTDNDKLGDYDLPKLKKTKRTSETRKSDGPVVLFPSDSESDADDDGEAKQKKKRGKRGSKKNKYAAAANGSGEISDDDGAVPDIIQDMKASDW